jgi:hypothetical protein
MTKKKEDLELLKGSIIQHNNNNGPHPDEYDKILLKKNDQIEKLGKIFSIVLMIGGSILKLFLDKPKDNNQHSGNESGKSRSRGFKRRNRRS